MIQIHLSDWIEWSAIDSLPETPGVYVIAKGSDKKVIYIGKTWGNEGLRGRIKDFDRSAKTGQKGHAGGVTYNKQIGNRTDDLHLAVHVSKVIAQTPEIMNAYIMFAERKLIWEHVELNGFLPDCNAE